MEWLPFRERLDDDASREGRRHGHVPELCRAGVVGVLSENAGLVSKQVFLEEVSVRHHAEATTRRQERTGERVIVEIETHQARRLVEPKRHVELTALQVQPVDHTRVEIDVLPGARCLVEFALNVVEHTAENRSFDGNPLTVWIEDVLRIRPRFRWEIAPVVLRLHADAGSERVAEIDGRMLVEGELHLRGGGPGAGGAAPRTHPPQ